MLFCIIGICPGICNHSREVWLKHKVLPIVWRQLAWVIWVCALEPELWPGCWLKDRHNYRDCSDSFCTSSPAVFWHWQNKPHKLAGTQNINHFHFLVKTMLLNPAASIYPEISYLDPLTSLPHLPRACCERKPLSHAQLIRSTDKPFPHGAPFCTAVLLKVSYTAGSKAVHLGFGWSEAGFLFLFFWQVTSSK